MKGRIMEELKVKQKIVIVLSIIYRLLFLIGFVTLILSFLPDSKYRFFNPIGFIILINIINNRICTCKRCGYKMNQKEFISKRDLLCPNGKDHNVL